MAVLGSGSSGNCAVVETEHARILVDAGFSGKQIRERLSLLGRGIEDLDGILLTHEHQDHCAGLAILCEKYKIPLYCNKLTAGFVKSKWLPKFSEWRCFETGSSFVVKDLTVQTFSVPHDAYDPVGFVVGAGGVQAGFLTDLGHVTRLALDRVRLCRALVLEANHDPHLLQNDTKRPWAIKQRILSRHGHLSNEAASKAIEFLETSEMSHLFLGHLSPDCNTPDLALESVRQALGQKNATHVHLEVAKQDKVSGWIELF